MEIELGHIIQDDVYETLRALPSDSFAAGIADGPYGMGLKGVDWDRTPDFGPWIEEAHRVLAPGGTMFVFGKPEIVAENWNRFPKPKDLLVWHFTNKVLPKLHYWQPTWDAVVAFSKGTPRFFRDQVRDGYSERYRALLGKERSPVPGRYGNEPSVYEDNGGTLPKNVLIGPGLIGRYGAAERVGHPTQKPLWLMEKLILSATLPGDAVLDLFAGAGTTSVAAARLGRKWLAVERDHGYAEMIRTRIAKVNADVAR
jgi:DNA modification methylase